MVPASDNRRNIATDRRSRPRKARHARGKGDRRGLSLKAGKSAQKMLFPALLFFAYILIARPITEPTVSSEVFSCNPPQEIQSEQTTESDRTPASVKHSKLLREVHLAPVIHHKKEKAPVAVSKKKFKPRTDIGPSVTFSTSHEPPVVINDEMRASTAEAAKGRFPSSISLPVAERAKPDAGDNSDLDVSDDFAVSLKKNRDRP